MALLEAEGRTVEASDVVTRTTAVTPVGTHRHEARSAIDAHGFTAGEAREEIATSQVVANTPFAGTPTPTSA